MNPRERAVVIVGPASRTTRVDPPPSSVGPSAASAARFAQPTMPASSRVCAYVRPPLFLCTLRFFPVWIAMIVRPRRLRSDSPHPWPIPIPTPTGGTPRRREAAAVVSLVVVVGPASWMKRVDPPPSSVGPSAASAARFVQPTMPASSRVCVYVRPPLLLQYALFDSSLSGSQ